MYSSFTHNLLCSLRDVVEYYLPLILSSLGAYFEKSRTRSNLMVLGLTKCFVLGLYYVSFGCKKTKAL